MFQHDERERFLVKRDDIESPLASYSNHAIELDGYEWPTVEHYYQAMKYGDSAYAAKIRQAATPKEANKLGNSWWRRKRKDWKQVKVVVMTRATYIKCRSYPEVAQALLDSGEIEITETSLYDYFWGCGRDQRGVNAYGQMLMDIRDKLRADA